MLVKNSKKVRRDLSVGPLSQARTWQGISLARPGIHQSFKSDRFREAFLSCHQTLGRRAVHWRGEKESLDFFAFQSPELRHLLFCFHSFNGNTHVEVARQAKDRAHDL